MKCDMIRKVTEMADIECEGKARWLYERDIACCDECALALVEEGFFVTPLPKEYRSEKRLFN